jgi:tetratricopeptide (TPR) repeat protein
LGWVFIRNGQKNKGIEHLKESYNIDPNNCDVLTKLGEVLLREPNGLEEAEKYLRRAISIDENMPDALVALGRVYEKKGDID